ncbi:MAG: methyl-accepting chemotaxis protein [Spirulina sp. SIO3F2]|nr:methyl-accepting chemotaxis protein [Spirulina sp. SIO3F2]
MQQGTRINQFVLGGFGVIVLFAGATTLSSFLTNRTLREARGWVSHTFEVTADLRKLEKLLVDAETGQRGFVITKEERYLEPYDRASAALDETFAGLRQLIADNPEQLARLDDIEALSAQKLAELQETIALKRQGQEDVLLALIKSDKGKKFMEEMRLQLADMVAVENQLLAERQQQAVQAERWATWVNWGGFGSIVIVAIATSMVIIRLLVRALGESLQRAANVAESVAQGDLTVAVETQSNDEVGKLMSTLGQMTDRLTLLIGGVKRSGIEVTSSATQIAAAGKQLEVTMREQSVTTQETTTTAQTIAETAQALAQTMEEVAKLANLTKNTATESQTGLNQMESTTQQLVAATQAIATRLGMISEKANNINTVITTITKVADQTNLLSLNAAIEAEKAGEYGAGFAVVAREIRRLADQTAVATLEIESMVKEMQSSVSTGVMEMDKFSTEVNQSVSTVSNLSGQVAQIIHQVQDLAPRFETVNQGMESQVQSATQISEAMLQLNTVARHTNESFDGINAAIAQLNQAAQTLQQEMSRFKVREQYDYAAPPSPALSDRKLLRPETSPWQHP